MSLYPVREKVFEIAIDKISDQGTHRISSSKTSRLMRSRVTACHSFGSALIM